MLCIPPSGHISLKVGLCSCLKFSLPGLGWGHRLQAHVSSLASALYPSEESGLLNLGHKRFTCGS